MDQVSEVERGRPEPGLPGLRPGGLRPGGLGAAALGPAALLLILIALTAGVLWPSPLVPFDQHVRAVVLGWARSPGWHWLGDGGRAPARLLTDLGSPVVAVPVLALSAVAAAARQRSPRPLGTALLGVLLVLVTVIPAKILIGRAGPGLPPVQPGHFGVFPSGHTATAGVCLSLAVLLLVPGPPSRAWRLAVAGLAVLVLAVGAALIWCDYHWFSDVAASWALTALIVPLTLRLAPPGRPGRAPGRAPGRPAAGRGG
jgi:membrane-associated phospholipid phosphatase